MRRALAAIGGLLMLAAVTANLLRMNRLAETDEVKTAAPLAHVTQTIETAEPVAEEANEPERDMSAWETAAETDEVKAAAPLAHVTQTIETAEPVIVEINEPERDMSAWETAAEYIAKTIYGEALVCSTTERAAVAWCILNRADDARDTTPAGVIAAVTKPHQFHGYAEDNPVLPELKKLALDVIGRWLDEKDGETGTGRVLPREYLFFTGDGVHNHFRTEWEGGQTWDWSLDSPYEE